MSFLTSSSSTDLFALYTLTALGGGAGLLPPAASSGVTCRSDYSRLAAVLTARGKKASVSGGLLRRHGHFDVRDVT